MELEKPVSPATAGEFSATPQRTAENGTLVKIFLNPQGLRAGWRLLLYVIFVVVLFLVPEDAGDAAMEVHSWVCFPWAICSWRK